MERSTICHQGRSITIVNIAIDAHMRHGDYFGACSEANRSRNDNYYRAQRGMAEPDGGLARGASVAASAPGHD